MGEPTTSPPRSIHPSTSFSAGRASRSSSTTSRPALSLDLSSLPPLSQPTPPSNTLLITGLHDLVLFQPASLDAIRAQITAIARLNSFSPLPSLRRIVCSFHSDTDAIEIRKLLDGTSLLDRQSVRAKIYFGEPTPLLDDEHRPKLLGPPQSDKLFFISPPPSPPHGWVMRNEEPPNKEVHATDLAHALSQLKTDPAPPSAPFPDASSRDPDTPLSLTSEKRTPSWPANFSAQRSRSSTLIFHPEDHGGTPDLPAVMVEDTSADLDDDMELDTSPIDMSVKKMPPKTSRPPVELME